MSSPHTGHCFVSSGTAGLEGCGSFAVLGVDAFVMCPSVSLNASRAYCVLGNPETRSYDEEVRPKGQSLYGAAFGIRVRGDGQPVEPVIGEQFR